MRSKNHPDVAKSAKVIGFEILSGGLRVFAPLRSYVSGVLIILAFVLTTTVFADDIWILTTSDFHRTSVGIESVDEHHLIVGPAGGEKTSVPLESVVRLDRGSVTMSAASKFTMFLQGGDHLTGEPGDLKDEQFAWSSAVVGDLLIPLSKIRGVTRSASPTGLDADRKEDQVALLNHDIVRGVVTGLEEGKILMQTGGDTVPIPIASADSVLFASSAIALRSKAVAWRVRFNDGSLLTVPSLSIHEGRLHFSLTKAEGSAKPSGSHSALLSSVVSIEQLNGPVSWLSDRTPSVNEQTPFSSEMGYPAQMDANVFGKPLRVGSQTFEKGIGTHANSVLTFPLDGSYQSFRTRYAIDTTTEASQADVTVRIRLDGKLVHEEKNVRAFRISPVLTVDVSGAKEMTLEVVAAGSTDTQDRLDWIEPALVRAVATHADSPTSRPAIVPAATDVTEKKP